MPTPPSFSTAVRFWLKLGFISFGGPTGQIAIMHEELVVRRRWIGEERFLHALSYCMLLPGPEAQQLATYIGWLLHGTRGGIAAGCLFVLPSVFVLIGLSWTYLTFGSVPLIASIFAGLKAAVVAIVAAAVIRIGQRALRHSVLVLVAAAAYLSLAFLQLPFPLVIALAGLFGFLGVQHWPEIFVAAPPHGHGHGATAVLHDSAPVHTTASAGHAARVLAVCGTLWLVPIGLLWMLGGGRNVFFQQALFFSKAAMVTFGGAYAVLPYIAQAGVETYGWLTAPQVIDGLGLAETTPGPLIMVVAFIAYVGGWTHATGLAPAVGGAIGALVATYFTFLPCFLWIFLGAPYIEMTRGNLRLHATLSAITAAVVGVVLNLAVYFARHVLFPGDPPVDWFAILIASVAFAGLWRRNWNVAAVIIVSAFVRAAVANVLG